MSKSKRTYTRYSSNSALKNGSATTIYRHVQKEPLCEEYYKIRESHKTLQFDYEALRNENEQLKVVKEQKEQQMKDNKKLMETAAKRNDRIKELEVEIIQLNGHIKLIKETSVDRSDFQRLEGFNKKKDQQIKELETRIDETKLGNLYNLENQINQLKKENEELKAKLADVEEQSKKDNPQSRFDMIRVLSDDIQKVMKENDDLKNERDDYKGLAEEWREQSNEICNLMGKDTDGWSNIAGDTLSDVKDLLYERDTLKEEHKIITEKLSEYRKISTQLFDLG